MVRNFLPLLSLSLTFFAAPALAEDDDALVARITAAAEKACGRVQVYDGSAPVSSTPRSATRPSMRPASAWSRAAS